MNYLACLFLLCLSPSFLFAQEEVEARGTLLYYTKDKILHIKIESGSLPSKGQKVNVDKSFQLGQIKGTHSLAVGEVIGGDKRDLEIKVSKYTSTMEEDGVTRPMTKKGDEMILEWKGEPTKRSTNEFEDRLEEAQLGFKKKEYKETILLLDDLIQTDEDCSTCYYLRGRCYLSKYREEKAIADFSKVIALNDGAVEGAENSYFYRAKAYASDREYEKASADYDKLLKLKLDASEIAFLLKQKLDIHESQIRSSDYDPEIARQNACTCVQSIILFEGNNKMNKGRYNKHCGKDRPAKKPSLRTDLEVISQSKDRYTITVKVLKTPQDCMKTKDLSYTPTLKTDACGTSYICKPNFSMSMAVVKVSEVKGDIVTLNVLYWQSTINGEPYTQKYDAGDVFSTRW